MLDQQKELTRCDTETLVSNFLIALFNSRHTGADRGTLFAERLAEKIHCSGFPEFNPKNRMEFSGFMNYLQDVFAQAEFSLEPLRADDESVVVRMQIQGNHHEEFMGLPASGGLLAFSATTRFKLQENRISAISMEDKKVTLTTTKGVVYQMKSAA